MATLTREKIVFDIPEWKRVTDGLLLQIEGWAKNEGGWVLERFPDEDRVEEWGTFPVSILSIKADGGEVTLEPVPQRRPEMPFRVSMSAWPTMRRVRLQSKDSGEHWEVITSSGIPLRQPWSIATFVQLVQDLLDDSE